MIKKMTIISLLLMSFMAQAQDVYKYAIHFTDKENTPYSFDNPEEFLSQRSIERRERHSVTYTSEDLPIDPVYISSVLEATDDAKLIIPVKWLNAIIISLSDTNNIDVIKELDFVEKTEFVFNYHLKSKMIDKFPDYEIPKLSASFKNQTEDYDSAFYGGGWVQIHQLMGEKLHQQNYQGQDIVIAVLDAGFVSADTLDIFDRLWENDQILGTANMVDPGNNVFNSHTHGTSVLSTMGGYWPGYLVGTAPEAKYYLIRTEDGSTENIIEEYNWAAGAAFADSVGADVLNTSLGYIDFDDSLYNHSYEDLDGNSTIITRASNIAFSKGMLPVNSAGNSGNGSWRYITAPADATDIITVGAVDADGVIASFSSHGFPWSEEVKPNVVARGKKAYIASAYSNEVYQGSGTSFSSPIMAGMVASLWSANHDLSPFQIKLAIKNSCDRLFEPDTLYGYGMPNFEIALSILGVQEQEKDHMIKVFPNPCTTQFELSFQNANTNSVDLMLYNTQGQIIWRKTMNAMEQKKNINIEDLPCGLYILNVQEHNKNYKIKINKL